MLVYVFLYLWDIFSVMFFILGFVLFYCRYWGWYYVFFLLAIINCEIIFFFIVVYLIIVFGRINIRTIGVYVIM